MTTSARTYTTLWDTIDRGGDAELLRCFGGDFAAKTGQGLGLDLTQKRRKILP
jgi:hypothetical protein